MQDGTWIMLIVLSVWIILTDRHKRRKISAIIKQRKNHNEEAKKMKDLAQKFIGKDCVIYTISDEFSSIKGVITEVSDSGILVEYQGNIQAVNLEFITRIQEWPKNKKGKKKNILL